MTNAVDKPLYPAGAVEGIPRNLFAAMRAELPDLTDEIIGQIRRGIPEYARSVDGPYGEALRTGVALSLKAFVDLVADPSAPTGDRDATCRLLGEFEAAEGRSLDDLQAAYRIGCQVAWRRLTKVLLRARVSAAVTAALADALLAYAGDLAALSGEGFRAAQRSSSAVRQQCRVRLARLILAQPAVPREAIESLAEQAQWVLPGTVTLVALRASGGAGRADLSRVEGEVLADLGGPVPCLVVPAAFTETLRSLLATALGGYRAAVGLTVPLDLAADSLRWAQQALDLADRGLIGSLPVMRCDEHLVELWLLSDRKLADQIVRRQLGILDHIPRQEREWLLDTFEPWLERRGTATDIARALGVHPQTVRYRINRLKEVFGDLIDDPDQRLAFELALRVLRLRRKAGLEDTENWGQASGAQPTPNPLPRPVD